MKDLSLQDLSIVEDHDPHQIHASLGMIISLPLKMGFEHELFKSLLDECEPQQLLSELFMKTHELTISCQLQSLQLLKKVVASAGK